MFLVFGGLFNSSPGSNQSFL